MSETQPELLSVLIEMEWTAAGVIAQIDSCGPTEMIGAAFDGRELELLRNALNKARTMIAKAKESAR